MNLLVYFVQLFSDSCSARLEYLIQMDIIDKEVQTTASFLQNVNDWFNSMSSRYMGTALFVSSSKKIFY